MTPVDLEAEKSQIRRHIAELEIVENRKDIEGILELVADDFEFVYRDSRIEGKRDAGDMLRRSTAGYLSSRHVPLRIEVSSLGDLAWLLGYELNRRETDGKVIETKQHYVITFRKVEGRWMETLVCIA